MGRHSAPDDALDDDAADPLAVATLRDVQLGSITEFRRGRHARDDGDSSVEPETVEPGPSGEPAPADAVAGESVPAESVAAPARSGGNGSAADLRLVREHADVRARCIAAVVVPFAAYVVVFAVLGRLGVSALLWIWIPLITAGVLVGVFLDSGHKRYGADGPAVASKAS